MNKLKRAKVQITLPWELSTQIEALAKTEFMTKSSWVERAIVSYLEKIEGENKSKKRIELNI